tara:strand:+ start:1391 stop:1777 length:387 start_codon:yes stop_codon:yes gene_type:complete
MAHYAKVNNGIVEKVIVAEASFFDTFIDSSPGQWIQTSYNTSGGLHYSNNYDEDTKSYLTDGGTPLRKNFAGVGYTYDKTRDAFIQPQPYPSWTLNEDTCQYESLVTYPDDGKKYNWNEETTNWTERT